MPLENNIEASVVIPCWNVAPWLPRCLNSVFAALPPAFEVIAVDDGSEDSTGEILRSYAAKYGELKIITQKNRGVSSARNRGLDVCRGEYVFFVDPDDSVEIDFFRAMLSRIRSEKADYCVVAFSGSKLKAEYEFATNEEILNGYVKRIIGYSFGDVERFNKGERLFAAREMASVWRGVFKRSIIEEHNVRFDESIELYEDAVFNAEYLVHAQRMTCIDRALYNVTARDSGAMRTVPRDAVRLCRNKLRLLMARERLDRISGGRLWPMCEASCVFSALEILSCICRCRTGLREGWMILAEYLANSRVALALRAYPLSFKHPVYAAGVILLRAASGIVSIARRGS